MRRFLPRSPETLARALLLAGAAIPLARVLPDPAHLLPGSEAGDVYKHAWGYWHTLVVLGDGSWPRTSLLNAPEGGFLLDVMLLPALILSPVTALFGPVVSANLWVLGSLLALGGAVYALSRKLTGSVPGSVAAGLVAQTTPFLVGHALASGVHERLSIWIFPLTLLALLRIREGSRRWSLALVGALVFTTIHCHTFGLLAGLMAMGVVAAGIALGPDRRVAARLLVPPLLVALGLMGAVYGGVHHLLHLAPYLAGVPADRTEAHLGVSAAYLEVATFRSLLDPSYVAGQLPKRMDDELFNLSYLGWVPLSAAVAAGFIAFRRRRQALLAVLGLVIAIIAPFAGAF